MKVENKMTPENDMDRVSPSASVLHRECQCKEKPAAYEGK